MVVVVVVVAVVIQFLQDHTIGASGEVRARERERDLDLVFGTS